MVFTILYLETVARVAIAILLEVTIQLVIGSMDSATANLASLGNSSLSLICFCNLINHVNTLFIDNDVTNVLPINMVFH